MLKNYLRINKNLVCTYFDFSEFILHEPGYQRQSDDMVCIADAFHNFFFILKWLILCLTGSFGQDIWLPIRVFHNALSTSKTKSHFVKNCAVPIFGIKILSNWCFIKSKGAARPKLDEIKLLTLKGELVKLCIKIIFFCILQMFLIF